MSNADTHPYIFTSEHALRRSIHRRHPTLTPDQLDATFETMRKLVGWKRNKEGDWISPTGAVNDKSELNLRNAK